jgi:phosphate transport system protein
VIETRKTFHDQLEDVSRDIIRLAAHVTEMIPKGTDALLAGDLQSLQEVIDSDDEPDELSIWIEEQCYQILALQQPMAADMRAVVTAIRLASEIERSGDLVVNICKGARRVYPFEISPTIRGLIEQMAEQAAKLFRLAMDAYVDRDAGLAAALDDMDDTLDVLHKQYIETLLSQPHEGDLQEAVQFALIGRYYERIGDHAVNIGEQIRYMVDGWLPEHAGAARMAAKRALAESSAPPPSEDES